MHGHHMGRRIIDGNDDGYINSNVLGDLHIDDHPYRNGYLDLHRFHYPDIHRDENGNNLDGHNQHKHLLEYTYRIYNTIYG
jgi:hypothetical protein